MSLSCRQFPDFSRRNFGNRFLKDSAPTLIQYDVQGFVKWHGIPCTRLDIVLISARTVKVFYIKIKNPEVETDLVPRLHLGDSLYAGNALVKNRSGSAYIKIISTRDTDERIIDPEIELEELDKIAISHLKNSSSCDQHVQTYAVNVIATDNQSTRSRSLQELLHLDHKRKHPMWIELLINIAIYFGYRMSRSTIPM